jgi:predicted glycosyltransferase
MRATPLHPLPTLLFYCQHSLGIGHLTRSFALVRALTHDFHVVFLIGGRLPEGVDVPASMELIDLPPLGMDDGHTVVSRDESWNVEAAQAQRRALILQAVKRVQPQVLIVELFPFGRKKFAGEILALIRAARRQNQPALVACSLRDILVDARPDQRRHDDRARWLCDRYFDLVLVHSDAAFARLEDSFRPTQPMRTRVVHTGYVVPDRSDELLDDGQRQNHLLISAGGGIVGEPMFSVALAARSLMKAPPPMRIIAGPFLPQSQWEALQARVQGTPGVTLLRHVGDMVAEMRAARASLSQCGYNTALDLLVSGVPALVVPYETVTENEQRARAGRLEELGAVQQLRSIHLSPPQLAQALDQLMHYQPRAAALGLGGAQRSKDVLLKALAAHRSAEPACLTA